VYPTDHAQFFAFWSRVYLNEWLFAAIVLVCIWKSRAGFESIGMVRPQIRTVVLLAMALIALALVVSLVPEGVGLSLATEAQRQSFAWTSSSWRHWDRSRFASNRSVSQLSSSMSRSRRPLRHTPDERHRSDATRGMLMQSRMPNAAMPSWPWCWGRSAWSSVG
jgi:hypothetical protein